MSEILRIENLHKTFGDLESAEGHRPDRAIR